MAWRMRPSIGTGGGARHNLLMQNAAAVADTRHRDALLAMFNSSDIADAEAAGAGTRLGKRPPLFYGILDGAYPGEQVFSDKLTDTDSFVHRHHHVFEKKRRLTPEQVRSLELSFESENKLEPERKMKLAEQLGLQPRQVAVWFQNRRARWKAKEFERLYDSLKSRLDAVVQENDSLRADKERLEAEVSRLKAQMQRQESEGRRNLEGENSNGDGIAIGMQSNKSRIRDFCLSDMTDKPEANQEVCCAAASTMAAAAAATALSSASAELEMKTRQQHETDNECLDENYSCLLDANLDQEQQYNETQTQVACMNASSSSSTEEYKIQRPDALEEEEALYNYYMSRSGFEDSLSGFLWCLPDYSRHNGLGDTLLH